MAVDWFVCGQAGGSTDSLVIPIDVDVPRSDPVLGATLIFVYYQVSYLSPANVISASDDATPQDAYSDCISPDGLNHYLISTFPGAGIIVNDLEAGTHSITVELDSVPDWVQAVAIAVTGVGPSDGGSWPVPFDADLSTWLFAKFQETAEQPVGGGGTTSEGVGWHYDVGGGPAVVFIGPAGAADGNWDWVNGDAAFYVISRNSSPTDQGGWAWGDAAIDDFFQWNFDPGIGRYMALAIGVAAVVPTLAGPSLAGLWGDTTTLGAVGGGLAFQAGVGPVCPGGGVTFGNPTFNKVIPV